MTSHLLPALAGALVLIAIPATAQERVQVGALNCAVSGSVGLLITERKELACNHNAPDGKLIDRYVGVINSYGLAIGASEGGYMAWTVLAPTAGPRPGSLAGNYSGVSAGATAGVGGTANLLIGGSERAIQLQPLSLQGQTGLNVAAGVTALQLRAVR
jgi:hypothetical protein